MRRVGVQFRVFWFGLGWVLAGFLFIFSQWEYHERGREKENILPNNLPSDIDYELKELLLRV